MVQEQTANFVDSVVNVAVVPVAGRGGRVEAEQRFTRQKPSARELRELLGNLGWIEKRSRSMVCVMLPLPALG